jgi:hypothetical protein
LLEETEVPREKSHNVDVFVVDYGLLLLSNVRLYFRRMENNPIAFVGKNAFENLPQLASL